jgi:ribosomal protein S18 acetylase RimI-like enzyme
MNKLFFALVLSIPSLYGMDWEELDEGLVDTVGETTGDQFPKKVKELVDQWQLDLANLNLTSSSSKYVTRYQRTDDDDEPVGLVTAAIKDPNLFEACCFGDKWKAYIDIVAVAPSHRRKGIAKKLINALLDDMQHNPHISEVTAFVRPKNSAAAALFERLGFQEQLVPFWAPKTFTYFFDKERKQK